MDEHPFAKITVVLTEVQPEKVVCGEGLRDCSTPETLQTAIRNSYKPHNTPFY